MKQHLTTLCILLLSCSILACGDAEAPPLTSPNNQNNTFDIGDKGDTGDLLDVVEPPKDTEEDSSNEPDTDDSGQPPSPRTLKDYRLCENDNDCPVNMGSCIKVVTLNRIDSQGTRTLALSNLFPETLQPHQGVCTLSCTESPNACASLSLNGLQSDQAPHTCQLIAVGESPYPANAIDFPVNGLEPREQAAGQAFAAICRPPVELHPEVDNSFCSPCNSQNECGDQGAICWSLLHKAPLQEGQTGGSCLSACENNSHCPMGFACDATDDDGQSYCRPILDTCTNCRDLDQDGYGTGYCGTATHPVTPHDCDDSNPLAFFDPFNMNHPFPTYCGQHDYNCNGISDDVEQIGSSEFSDSHCSACNDTCRGDVPNGKKSCKNATNLDAPVYECKLSCDQDQDGKLLFENCDGDPATGCEVSVTDQSNIYYRDLDGDGFGDPNDQLFACNPGVIPTGYVANNKDCNDDDKNVYPGAPEICDGLDNNCNEKIDEDIAEEGLACTTSSAIAECKPGKNVCQGTQGMVCVSTQNFDWYPDLDQDGFGDASALPISSCDPPADNYVKNNTDCNDADNTLNPDTRWYPDKDKDGYGDAEAEDKDIIKGCQAPPSRNGIPYVKNNADCNDNDNKFNPDAAQLCGVDNRCTGDPAVTKTFNNQTINGDCNSDNLGICQPGALACADNRTKLQCVSKITPGAVAEICDGKDNSCNGTIDDGCPQEDNLQRNTMNAVMSTSTGTINPNDKGIIIDGVQHLQTNTNCQGINTVWTHVRVDHNHFNDWAVQRIDVGCKDLKVTKQPQTTPHKYNLAHRDTIIDANYYQGPSIHTNGYTSEFTCPSGEAIYKVEVRHGSAMNAVRFYCRGFNITTESTLNNPVTSQLVQKSIPSEPSLYFGVQSQNTTSTECPENYVAYGATMTAGKFKLGATSRSSLLGIQLHCVPMSMLTY